ncbi:MAG: glutaredoxin domain-containing protein [Hyphomicrobium sp.]
MKIAPGNAPFGRLMGALAVVALLVLSPSLAESRPSSDPRAPSNPAKVTVYLFWTPTCPHCVKAKTFLEALAANMPEIRLRTLELSTDEAHDRAFQALNTHFRIKPPAVPLIAVGDDVFVGFDTDDTTGAELRSNIAQCRRVRCADVAGSIINREASQIDPGLPPETGGGVRRPPIFGK